MSDLSLKGVDVAILVGGIGKRLRKTVPNLPKPLAPVLGRPFLFYLLDLLALRGARSAILCCGYKADLIQASIGASWLGMPIVYSIEDKPLGTGGALALARKNLSSERVLVMNGDSLMLPDFGCFRQESTKAEACIAVVEMPNASRFGTIAQDQNGRILKFQEKYPVSGPGLINGGAYFLSQNILSDIPIANVSLEQQIFPVLAERGQLTAFHVNSPFIDIGVSESYEAAGDFFRNLGIAPHTMFPDAPPTEQARVKFGVCIVIFDESERVLLERRSDCGWWCLPGGKLDAGENIAEGAVREAREETGLNIKITSFLGVFSDPRRRTVRYPDNGDLRHLVDATVISKTFSGEIRASSESLELAWFGAHELPINTVSPVVEILRCAFDTSLQGLLR